MCLYVLYFHIKMGINNMLGNKVPLLLRVYSHLRMPDSAEEGSSGRGQLKTVVTPRGWSRLMRDVPWPGSPNEITTKRLQWLVWFCFALFFFVIFNRIISLALQSCSCNIPYYCFQITTFNQEPFGDVKLGVLVHSS